ncbi:MAG: hypothetical protein AAGJ31_14145, partial [Verrucomicrobiota bacterium]
LDSEGELLRTGVRSQETYVEDKFEISPEALQAFVAAIDSSNAMEAISIPGPFAREVVASAYLGMVDVNPLGGKETGGAILGEDIQLWARRCESTDGNQRIEIWGHSRCEGKAGRFDRKTGGREWHNRVHLTWTGKAILEGETLVALVALANGNQSLTWNHGAASPSIEGETPRADVAHLPAGRPIQFSGPVRFGISIP